MNIEDVIAAIPTMDDQQFAKLAKAVERRSAEQTSAYRLASIGGNIIPARYNVAQELLSEEKVQEIVNYFHRIHNEPGFMASEEARNWASENKALILCEGEYEKYQGHMTQIQKVVARRRDEAMARRNKELVGN